MIFVACPTRSYRSSHRYHNNSYEHARRARLARENAQREELELAEKAKIEADKLKETQALMESSLKPGLLSHSLGVQESIQDYKNSLEKTVNI